MCREAAARRRWKPHRVAVDLSVSTASAGHSTAGPSYVAWPINRTAYRPPRSRSKSVVGMVDRVGGRGAVLSVAGLPAPAHPGRSVQRLVDGLLVTVLGVFVVAVVAAVTLARRRRRAVAAGCDEYAVDDCVELGELVTEVDQTSSPDDDSVDAPPPPTSEDWNVDEDRALGQADVTSLTPLCARSTSSAASSVSGGSTPSDTPLYWPAHPSAGVHPLS